jgi:hypothetical protein
MIGIAILLIIIGFVIYSVHITIICEKGIIRHYRLLGFWDVVIMILAFSSYGAGLCIMSLADDRGCVNEIKCPTPAEIKYEISTVSDGTGTLSQDTIFVYTFDQEIKHKHYPKNNNK